MQNLHKKERKMISIAGMSVLEVLIGVTIITVGILALANTYGVYVDYALMNDKKTQVTYLLEEGIEAMSLLRDESWTNNIAPLSSATSSIYFNGSVWTISSTTNEYIDNVFVRNVRAASVNRDGSGRIAASGTIDPKTKLVTVTVSYLRGTSTTTESISKYLVNMYGN